MRQQASSSGAFCPLECRELAASLAQGSPNQPAKKLEDIVRAIGVGLDVAIMVLNRLACRTLPFTVISSTTLSPLNHSILRSNSQSENYFHIERVICLYFLDRDHTCWPVALFFHLGQNSRSVHL